MGAMTFEQTLGLQIDGMINCDRGPVIEEIEGLIKVYKNGHVERPLVVPCVSSSLDMDLGVVAKDFFIDRVTNLWARVYVPKDANGDKKFPVVVYYHGGGFCVGSAAWKCYHDFLGNLSSRARCVIVSVNYRLAPENPLPSAYEDGFKALKWVKQQASCQSGKWWTKHCNFSSIFLAGDSAGANLAYQVALKLGDPQITQLIPRGIILIQPFIGGEERTNSEKTMVQSRRSPLSLSTSDTYWRLVLPRGANRDHPWCNPLGEGARKLMNLRVFVCIAEKDILRDRNMEMCSFLANCGNEVEHMISEGVGHAFQILDKSELSQTRREELVSHIVGFSSK